MTDNLFVQFSTTIAMIVLIIMQKHNANKVAAKVATVKDTLQVSGERNDGKLKEIHDLVNSEMTKALAKIESLQKQLAKSERRRIDDKPAPRKRK